MRLIVVVVSMLLVCGYCTASCSFAPKDAGESTCTTSDGVVLQDSGESQKYPDTCLECTCRESGLSCCGYGIYAGAIQVPGCKVVADTDGCSPKLVDPTDESKPCNNPFNLVG